MSTQAVGKRLPRVDAVAKVTGRAIFGIDVHLPGMLVGKFLGSPHAHALVRHIDTRQAEALPGVRAVLTAADLPTDVAYKATSRAHAILARDRVLFVGQPVAAVAAVDEATALEALDLIKVEYEPLPAVLDPVEAMRPTSPVIQHEGKIDRTEMALHTGAATDGAATQEGEVEARLSRNVVNEITFELGNVDAAWTEADVVVEHTYRMPMVHQGYIEPHAVTAHWDRPDHVRVLLSTQGTFEARNVLVETLGLQPEQITVEGTEIGGGFGAKMGFLAPLVVLLAKKAEAAVKLVLRRSEDLSAAQPAPGSVIHLKTGAKADGTFLALEGQVICDTGAYPGSPMVVIAIMLANAYNVPHLRIRGYEVVTNKPSVTAYRAPGGPNAAFAIESNVEEMARRLGMDPLEFRVRNAAEEGTLQPHGRPWGKIGARETLVALRPIWQRLCQGPRRDAEGRLIGRGVGLGSWSGGRGPGSAVVTLDPDGTWKILVGTVDLTGTFTAMVQIAADALGVSPERVRIYTADTDRAPWAPVSGGSQTTYGQGPAIIAAAREARRQVLAVAAQELEVPVENLVLEDEQVVLRGDPEKALPLTEIYRLTHGWDSRYPPILGKGSAERRKGAPSFAATVAEVAVDPETGKVTVTHLTTSQDVGKAINPLAVEGQIQGGTVQSVSLALWEELIFSPDGRVLNANLLDYRKATAADVPLVNAVIVEVPSEDGPFRARIVGEPSIVPPVGAIANAIADAIGVRITEVPITPERVWLALNGARKAEQQTSGR